ncbi:glycosyltransferase family 4 protein [Candidatus Omnitrophota bacterium]
MIKVLHLIKTLNLGGAESNLFNLVQGIDSEQFEIHVGYSFGGELEERFKNIGVKLFKFSKGSHKIKSFASFAIIWKIIIYILKNKIDIVHTHIFNAHVWGSIAAKITGAKIVEHVHDSRYLSPADFQKSREFNKQYRYVKYFKKVSDMIIVLTKQNYDFILDSKLYDKAQVREIQNGIPILSENNMKTDAQKELMRNLNIKENSLIILTATRISPEKNMELIFHIAPIVKKECPNAVFIISGDGPLFKEFQEKCQSLEDTIKMIGYYPRIDNLLRISHIFLLPSFLELHSLAILEAMSMKVPVVISNVGCNGEFFQNWDNGVILDPLTNDGWAEAILKLLKDTTLRQSIGQKGYELCKQRFEIKNIAKKIERIYVELVKK